jgi:hypothetical protein
MILRFKNCKILIIQFLFLELSIKTNETKKNKRKITRISY